MMKEEQDDEYIDSSDNESLERINQEMSTERFIAAVKSQPALWDARAAGYNSRFQKIKSWERVCYKVIPNFTRLNTSEKNETVTKLQRRWKSLRVCYIRELRQKMDEKNSNGVFPTRKEYRYYSQLSFLRNSCQPKESALLTVKPTHMLQKKPPETNVPKHEDTRSQKSMDDAKECTNDHDLNFLHSLLPHFRKVPEERKLDLQSEILVTLKKYVSWQKNTTNANENCEPYGHFLDIACGSGETDSEGNVTLELT
ncbi:uncharacterized protein LOC115442984 [Manduca sexta]|uniref:uncharacterized protein LOC115442984 n=1 Tax=Manduca sexta TaxID=7130 RepID=UPI00188F1B01|nr:uncharacterized protein LOC115442984 [Manduca sexta]